MKSIIATALLAATTYGYNLISMPQAPQPTTHDEADFVAGFIYGMTGINDLYEIENCFVESKEMTMWLELAVGDLEKGGWDNETQAALEFGMALLILPQTLTTCTGMDDEIAAIEEWATIFQDPTKLAATISKNYLLHKKKIDADRAAVEADLAAEDYFQCGVDTAQLATDAIGPINV